MRVFHGSAIEVKEPEIRTGKFTKDFGEGFYCTKLKRQAKRWAMRKETPTITTYDYTPDKTLSILDFKSMTDAWLDFIVDCITREQFWVLAKFKYPTHQICFATEASLKCLKFVGSEKLSKK